MFPDAKQFTIIGGSFYEQHLHGPGITPHEVVQALRRPSDTPKACGDPRLAVPLLRAFSGIGGNHFYTTSASELKNAVINMDYVDEGTTGYVFSSHEPGTIPLFRLHQPSTVDHFYTTSVSERDNALYNLGYLYEGAVGYVYPDATCGGQPLFRLYSEGSCNHFYTMSIPERDNASNRLNYTQEGIVGYIFPF